MSHSHPSLHHIRPMCAADLRAVMTIQAACYPQEYLEPPASFANKLINGSTCWVAEAEGQVAAYLVALPTHETALPALHADDWQPPAHPTLLYLHDMAVGPALRGMGVAHSLLDAARRAARQRRLAELALVAVQGSVPFWARHGFVVDPAPAAWVRAKLTTFGGDARYMTQPLILEAHQVP